MKKFSLKIKKKNLVRKRMEVYSVSKDSSLLKSLSSGVGWGHNRGNEIIISECKDKNSFEIFFKKVC